MIGCVGNMAESSNGGTFGRRTSCVDAACCAQCCAHNAEAAFVFADRCIIGMPRQCTLIAASLIGMSEAEQGYEANATC